MRGASARAGRRLTQIEFTSFATGRSANEADARRGRGHNLLKVCDGQRLAASGRDLQRSLFLPLLCRPTGFEAPQADRVMLHNPRSGWLVGRLEFSSSRAATRARHKGRPVACCYCVSKVMHTNGLEPRVARDQSSKAPRGSARHSLSPSAATIASCLTDDSPGRPASEPKRDSSANRSPSESVSLPLAICSLVVHIAYN